MTHAARSDLEVFLLYKAGKPLKPQNALLPAKPLYRIMFRWRCRRLQTAKTLCKWGSTGLMCKGFWDQVREEIQEVAELPAGAVELEEELGDLMFALVNVVRKQGFDPEKAMRQADQKFERRFRQVEQALVKGLVRRRVI